jgi:Raf kinase inhibitor-like YbhB/YbcL family protein
MSATAKSAFRLESPAFDPKGHIPERFTQRGQNHAPPLVWTGVPEETRSLVLLLEDPDAPVGTVTHWAACDIDPERGCLPENANGFVQARNDMEHARYDGPKPPPGHGPHRYRFRLTALDVASLGLPHGCASREMKEAARAHALAEAELVGTFETPA